MRPPVVIPKRPSPRAEFEHVLEENSVAVDEGVWLEHVQQTRSALADQLFDVQTRLRRSVENGLEQTADSEWRDLSEMALRQGIDILSRPVHLGASESDPRSPLRVVLLGRTQAGKSTLFESLSAGDGARRGDGRQRFSRDVCERPAPQLPGVVLVDTPGVGARDGRKDYLRAFEQVPGADLVVWVASNNSLQEETARALRQVGFLGKPIIVVINGLLDLGHPLKRERFLREPAHAFRDVDGDVRAIERQLNLAGVRPVSVVTLHADAAFESSQRGLDAEGLKHASRVDALLEVLRTEQPKRAPQRRALRLIDEVRGPACEFQAEMQLASERLEASITQARGMTRDLDRRWQREVDRHFEVLESQLRRAVDRRRDWRLFRIEGVVGV